MSEQYWGCSDKMSEANFSPAETLIRHVASSSRLTKFAENYGTVAQNEAALRINVLYIAYIEKILKHILVRY